MTYLRWDVTDVATTKLRLHVRLLCELGLLSAEDQGTAIPRNVCD